MKLRSVSWARTKGFDHAGVTVDLDEGDTFEGALAAARALVDVALGDATPERAHAHAVGSLAARERAVKP